MEGLDELTNAKERELQELKLHKEKQVSQILKSLQDELHEEKKLFSQLKGDFDYNLSLLASRDEELADYERSFAHIKSVINGMVAESSELKVQLDKVCKEVEREKAANLQLQTHHQARLKEIHSRMDSYRRVKQKELDEEREKLECLQRELRNKLLALEEEGHTQREAMMADFDESLKKRDHEHQLRLDQLSSSLLQHQSRQLHLEKELAHAQSARTRLEEELQQKCRECEQLVKGRKEEAWHMEGEVQQLQDNLQEWMIKYRRVHEEMDRMKQTFQRKHAELDRSVREKQMLLDAAKQAHKDSESVLEEELVKLRQRVEHKEGEWHHQENILQQTVLDKEKQLESLQVKMAAEGGSLSERVHELRQQLEDRSHQLQSVMKERHECQTALSRKDLDMCKLKRKLSVVEEKLQVSERCLSEQMLECEDRVREVEKTSHLNHKELIDELATRNKELTSKVEDANTHIEELAMTCARLGGEKDAAQELLREHNIPWPASASASHTSEIRRLQVRNKELLNIVAKMRAELEQLSDLTERKELEHEEERKKKEEVAPSVQYVTYLEKDVHRLKAEIRQMSEKLGLASKPPTPPKGGSRGGAAESSSGGKQQQLVDQVSILTDTIAHLQKQNTELERSCEEWKKKSSSLQDRLKEDKEMLYLMKATKTPQSRLHQKLLQATQVIISLVREKEVLSKHIQQLVGSTMPPSSNGILPFLNTHRMTRPVDHIDEHAQLSEGRSQRQQSRTVSQSVDRLVQTSPDWQLGRVCVDGRQPVELQVGRLVEAKDTRSVCGDLKTTRKLQDLDRMEGLQETGNDVSCRTSMALSGKGKDICKSRTISTNQLSQSPLDSSSTHQTDLLDQSLPSLRFSENSLEGGAAALEKMLEQVDQELAMDQENWSTPEEPKGPPARVAQTKPALEMVGKEIKMHTTSLAGPSSQSGKTRSKTAPKSHSRKPRNYNIRD